jgi:2-dehydropantoate 2-reductase
VSSSPTRPPRPGSSTSAASRTGVDEVDEALAAALRASRCESVARPDIMRWKYRKLLNNLGNAVRRCGSGLDSEEAMTALDLLADRRSVPSLRPTRR